MKSGRPIFYDDSGKRWTRVIRTIFWTTLIISLVGAIFCISIIILPASPISIPSTLYTHNSILIPRLSSHEEAARRFAANAAQKALIKQISAESSKHNKGSEQHSTPNSVVIGYYVNWDPESFISLRNHIDSLTHIMPEWLYLTPDGKHFKSREDDKLTHDGNVRALAASHGVGILPILHNLDNGTWYWPRLRDLLKDVNAQKEMAVNLRDYLLSNHFNGINIDFEPNYDDNTITEAERKEAHALIHEALPGFINILHQVFKPVNLLVTEDLPVSDNDFNYEALSNANDYVVVMLYDQHIPSGNPGPIASQQWIDEVTDKLFRNMDTNKVVIGVSNYCYDWPVKHDASKNILCSKDGEIISDGQGSVYLLGQILKVAEQAGAEIDIDEDELNPYLTYTDNKGQDHIAFVLDAITAYNTIQSLKGYKPLGAAIWRLGSEDPSIWSFFSKGKIGKPVDLKKLETVTYRNDVAYDINGSGEIMAVESKPSPGRRKLKTNADGLIDYEKFTRYPSEYIIRRQGDAAKCIALTFDDGPDPVYTPKILNVLKEFHVPATFFVIGKSAEKYPWIMKDCWDSGCEIGNHTFTHPHIGQISKTRTALELNATQRIIESVTGHTTKLFRPPFGEGADTNLGPDEVALVQEAQDFGYETVGMNIDPSDYQQPGISKIVERVVKRDLGKGHIILLHDGGGNRDQTLNALPLIIKELQSKGYTFVTVSGLMGPDAHQSLFPAVPKNQQVMAEFDKFIFEGGFTLSRIVEILFIISILLGAFRVLLFGTLAIMQSIRARKSSMPEGYTPDVTVIIPSYNEAKVICRTVQGLLDGDYQNLRIIIVDDGSTDNTEDVVRKEYGADPRITYVKKENGGKSSALNLGIEMADTEIIIGLDADTIFASDTISRLVPHFADPCVGAVAGNVKVGNRSNPLTIWQSVEYITSQNFDRRAYAALNSVSVIPGAVGAWRKSAILEAGGYGQDTLAEDTDLTFKIKLLGYRTLSENRALAYTEAPDTIEALAKQRFRWAFGTLQSLWKFRHSVFKRRHGAFGMFVLPFTWVYGVFFQALSPVVDIAVVISLLSHDFRTVMAYYAAFFIIDLLGAVLAIKLDGEDLKQTAWLFWQRIFYRQFMYYIILKSIITALKGSRVGWGKLQRKATVKLS